MDFFQVSSLAEAKIIVKQQFQQNPLASKRVSLLQAMGMFLAEDVLATVDVPSFSRSTVDGYSIKAANSFGASDAMPTLLQLVGQVHMGNTPQEKVTDGTTIYVPTGAMLPQGADGVVMIEHSQNYGDNIIAIEKPISPMENVISKGDDVKQGTVIATKGKRVTYQLIGVLAACGIAQVTVYEPLQVAVISTGDELMAVDQHPEQGKIYDINSYVLQSHIQSIGAIVSSCSIIQDQYPLLKAAMEQGLQKAHIVITSGGSSVGEKDYTYQIMDEMTQHQVLIKGISIKPGKPTLVANAQGKPLIGLPGHPVAAIVVWKILIEQLMEAWQLEYKKTTVMATLAVNLPSDAGKTTFQMVQLQYEDGQYIATPVFGKSGLITMFSQSNGVIQIADHIQGYKKGQQVIVELM